MLGIKKYVHELGNSMLATDRSLESILNQTIPNLSQICIQNHDFGLFLVLIDIMGIKKHVLEVGILMLASEVISTDPKPNRTKPKPKI